MSRVDDLVARLREPTATVSLLEFVIIAGSFAITIWWLGQYIVFQVAVVVFSAAYWTREVHRRKAQRGSFAFFAAGLCLLVLLGYAWKAFA